MKRFHLLLMALPLVLILPCPVQAQLGICRIHLFAVSRDWDNPERQRGDSLSAQQLKWWLKDGQKKFKDVCLVSRPDEADYFFFWAEKWQNHQAEIITPKTTTTEHSGTVTTTSTNGSMTTGTYHGTSSTTTNETTTYDYATQYVSAYVYKVETIEGKRQLRSIPVFRANHKGQLRWSKPDKDVLVDAVKYLARQK